MIPLLDVKNLSVEFQNKGTHTWSPVVSHVSFQITKENHNLAIVGESGSGKTMIGRALMGLLPLGARITAEKLLFMGQNLTALSEDEWQRIRGKEMGLILQDPKYSLNPNMKVGVQISEMYKTHFNASPRQAMERSLSALKDVRISDPAHVYHCYPHEISGGMGQRIMIAMMLASHPKLLIADEPTSALDQDNKIQFLNLVRDCIKHNDMGLLLISHDLKMVQEFSQNILIMYKGKAIDIVPKNRLQSHRHPYIQGLLSCTPNRDHPCERLSTINRAAL